MTGGVQIGEVSGMGSYVNYDVLEPQVAPLHDFQGPQVGDSTRVVCIRSDWNNIVMVDRMLDHLHSDIDAVSHLEHFEKKPPLLTKNGIPVLLRAGSRSVWDMFVVIPEMIKAHRLASKTFPKENTC